MVLRFSVDTEPYGNGNQPISTRLENGCKDIEICRFLTVLAIQVEAEEIIPNGLKAAISG
jgi:hypothetical protein